MDYRLELLDDSTFENLVNRLCQEILGLGVISFSKGKDGGRDGKFTGIANKFPSEASPWCGKFIIQAKHTENPVSSCSDSDFKKDH
ncbi:MAG: restriction endonuclease [Sporocytophaga sp.]|nr:restriction endonuclease [Sporocytophaga sp.]